MPENIDSLVLEQLRLIRGELGVMTQRLITIEDRLGDVDTKIDGLTGVVIGLGKYVHDLGGRVEHLEDRMGE